MKKTRCETCAFRAAAGSKYLCDYAAITGRTRASLEHGAVPPEKCRNFRAGKPEKAPVDLVLTTARRTGPWRSPREKPEELPEALAGEMQEPYDWARARKLLEQGASDKEIALALGCAKVTVTKWRRRRGLPGGRTWKKRT